MPQSFSFKNGGSNHCGPPSRTQDLQRLFSRLYSILTNSFHLRTSFRRCPPVPLVTALICNSLQLQAYSNTSWRLSGLSWRRSAYHERVWGTCPADDKQWTRIYDDRHLTEGTCGNESSEDIAPFEATLQLVSTISSSRQHARTDSYCVEG